VLPAEFHLCSLYTWKLNFGQTIWDKIEVLPFGTLWEIYIWEQFGNKRRKQKILLPHPLLKKKKICTVHKCMLSLPIGCMKFLFPKLFITIFRLG
jgi:hypothetical protein